MPHVRPDARARLNQDGPEPLPPPPAEALAVSERLLAVIHDEIAARGPISFVRYMELALYAPGLGYYSAGSRKFGAAGDFVTAPEISPLFSHCLARQTRQVLTALNGADVLEVGAGSGVMCAEVLAELERLDALPPRYMILELSAELRERQQQTIMERVPQLSGRVEWLDALPAPGFRGVVLANELLDAMPAHRLCYRAGVWLESMVDWADGALEWREATPGDPELQQRMEQISGSWPEAYITEVNLVAERWIASVAQVMEAGLILLIDYGFPQAEYYHPQRDRGTLMCHYRHRTHDNPLLWPGLQDITCHVDFTAMAQAGHDSGLEVTGYTSQAAFLLASGLTEMAAEQLATPRQQLERAQQIKTLTLPNEMGELFKVMALTRGLDMPLQGFALNDRRFRL